MDELIVCMPKQIQLNNEALKTELIFVRHVSSLFIQIRFERRQNDLNRIFTFICMYPCVLSISNTHIHMYKVQNIPNKLKINENECLAIETRTFSRMHLRKDVYLTRLDCFQIRQFVYLIGVNKTKTLDKYYG